MSVIYSLSAINARLNAVISTIDAGAGNGQLILLGNSIPISTITLAKPSGTVSGGVLTFFGPQVDPSALGTGNVTGAIIQDSNANLVISGLTAGPIGSAADIIISNGLNSTHINSGQAVTFLAGQIVGS